MNRPFCRILVACCLVAVAQALQDKKEQEKKPEKNNKHARKPIPEYLIPCNINDPDVSVCLNHSIYHTVDFMRRGFKNLGIRKIEPATLQATSFEFVVDNVKVKAVMNESTIENLSYFELRSASAINIYKNPEKKVPRNHEIVGNCYIIKLTIPYARLQANGSLILSYTSADGKLIIEGVDIDMGIKLCGEEIEDEKIGCLYHFNKLALQLKMDRFNANIQCNNGFKEKIFNLGLSLESQSILKRVMPYIKEQSTKQFLETIQIMTDGYACEDIRPRTIVNKP